MLSSSSQQGLVVGGQQGEATGGREEWGLGGTVGVVGHCRVRMRKGWSGTDRRPRSLCGLFQKLGWA